ncbi:MAG: response regulator [Flavobacteriales bacterium]|nr:response regulator [Flavobacteriales bacterium]
MREDDITRIGDLGIDLYLNKSFDEDKLKKAVEKVIHANEDPNKEYKVLLVDDSDLNNSIVTHMMSTYNCKVDSVLNGKGALEKLDKIEYDLIIMDVNMPIMDGIVKVQ